MILVVSQVVQRFQELFAQTKYKEAAELAAESPQGLLRTPDTVAKFQVYHLVSLFIYSLISNYSQILPYDIVLKGVPFRHGSSGRSLGKVCGMFHVLVSIDYLQIRGKNKKAPLCTHLISGQDALLELRSLIPFVLLMNWERSKLVISFCSSFAECPCASWADSTSIAVLWYSANQRETQCFRITGIVTPCCKSE